MLITELCEYISTASPAAVQEEFLGKDGSFEMSYIRQVLGDKGVTKPALLKELQNAGVDYISLPPFTAECEVSHALFHKHYEFGKFENVRGWISFFYWKYKKVLTRNALFTYILL
jgi:hypothetical protein